MQLEREQLPIHPVLAEMAERGPQEGEYLLRFRNDAKVAVLQGITSVLTPELLAEVGDYLVPHSNRTWMRPKDKAKYDLHIRRSDLRFRL